MTPESVIRPATLNDADEIASVWLRSRRASIPAIPRSVHTDAEVRDWIEGIVIPAMETSVVEMHGKVVALLALRDEWLDQLYVDPDWTRHGLGTSLVALAKQRRPQRLDLWTFATNVGTCRFYERHWFKQVGVSAENEEGALAIHYRWDGQESGLTA
jgi:GNAT superfamily N-acetyltransferase